MNLESRISNLESPSRAPRITVIVVAWNSAGCLRPTLEAALAQDYPDYEVWLVDNASSDGTLEVAREFEPRGLKILTSPVNRGFAGGNNDAVRASAAARVRASAGKRAPAGRPVPEDELIFLVNPDAIMMGPDTLREVARAFAGRADLGVLGAKLFDRDGRTILHYGGWIDAPAHCGLYAAGDPDDGRWDEPKEVDFVIGAAFAVRRSLWERLGGFDEDFSPAYYEDTDFCLRVRRLGLKVLAWPALRLVHPDDLKCTPLYSQAFWWYHHRHRLWFLVKHAGFRDLLARVIPAEARWFGSPSAAGMRRFMMRIYYYTLRRWIARRVLRIPPRPFQG